MHQDEIPKRRPHHRLASASATAAFATLPYPVSREEAARALAGWRIPLGGERVSLGEVLEAMPEEGFDDITQAIHAVDKHWGRVEDALLRGRGG